MNTFNGYSKSILTDSYLLGAGGGHVKDDFTRRSEKSFGFGKVAKISIPAKSNYLISIRGTNYDRDALVYVSGYGYGGTSSRITIRIIKSNDKYAYYYNGSEDTTGCIYVQTKYTSGSDSISVVSLGSITVPTITILEGTDAITTLDGKTEIDKNTVSFSLTNHTHLYLSATSVSNLNTPTSHDADGSRLIYNIYNRESLNLPGVVDNANALITLFKGYHNQGYQYASQLAFPDDGKVYYRVGLGSLTNNATRWYRWNTLAFTSNLATKYTTTEKNESGYYKININSTARWMLGFNIKLYQQYKYYDIRISGYNYNELVYHSPSSTETTKNVLLYWYEPKASLVVGDTDIYIYFGQDGVNSHNLWVAIPAKYYTGIEINNFTNGYQKIDLTPGELFTITYVKEGDLPLPHITRHLSLPITSENFKDVLDDVVNNENSEFPSIEYLEGTYLPLAGGEMSGDILVSSDTNKNINIGSGDKFFSSIYSTNIYTNYIHSLRTVTNIPALVLNLNTEEKTGSSIFNCNIGETTVLVLDDHGRLNIGQDVDNDLNYLVAIKGSCNVFDYIETPKIIHSKAEEKLILSGNSGIDFRVNDSEDICLKLQASKKNTDDTWEASFIPCKEVSDGSNSTSILDIFDLGSSDFRWKTLYSNWGDFSNSVYISVPADEEDEYNLGIRLTGKSTSDSNSFISFGCEKDTKTGTHENLWTIGRNDSNKLIFRNEDTDRMVLDKEGFLSVTMGLVSTQKPDGSAIINLLQATNTHGSKKNVLYHDANGNLTITPPITDAETGDIILNGYKNGVYFGGSYYNINRFGFFNGCSEGLKSLGYNRVPKSGRAREPWDAYCYNYYNKEGTTSAPSSYISVFGFGGSPNDTDSSKSTGSTEIAGYWGNASWPSLWFRTLRDINDNWTQWHEVFHTGQNYYILGRTAHTICTETNQNFSESSVALEFRRGYKATNWRLFNYNTGGFGIATSGGHENTAWYDFHRDALFFKYDGTEASFYGRVNAPNGFYESSDENLKDFYEDVEVDLEKLLQIPKKYFSWKNDPNNLLIGTSAQELQKIYPELVSQNNKGFLTVSYSKLSIIALKAIDTLYEEIKDLKLRIKYLESKIYG